jgi:hypothetical protein
MRSTRREFIQYIGIALASLLSTRCCTPTCYTPMPLTPFPSSSSSLTPYWLALQKCWLELKDPRLQSYEDTEFSMDLCERHAEALRALVSDGELSADVSSEIGAAFEQAVAHIQRQMVSCYITLPPEFAPRADLVRRITLLEEMSKENDIDPEIVQEMRTALERDMAWLAEFQAGRVPGEWEDAEVDAVSIEAARILVELLLEDYE